VHALIIGATEGAAPVGLTDSDPEKLNRTLAAAGFLNHAFHTHSIRDARPVRDAAEAKNIDSIVRDASPFAS
jgi:hypothetical protein